MSIPSECQFFHAVTMFHTSSPGSKSFMNSITSSSVMSNIKNLYLKSFTCIIAKVPKDFIPQPNLLQVFESDLKPSSN